MKRIMLLCLPLGSLSETTHSLEFLREYTLSIIHVLAVVVLLGLWHVRDTYVSSLFCYLVSSMGLSRKSRNKPLSDMFFEI